MSGPGSATAGHFAAFDDLSGTSVEDSGVGPADFAAIDDSRIVGAQQTSEKGIANGYAPLGADNKVSTAHLPDAVLGALKYQGTWNASTNTPAIPAADANSKGHYYIVTTPGGTDIDGLTDWLLGDWIVSNGASWDQVDNTDAVVSVAGLLGSISAASLKLALALVKADVGLGNVNDTADGAKPVSTAQATADLAAKSVSAMQYKTGSYTLVAGDAGQTVYMDNAAATNLTLPAGVLPAGSFVNFIQGNAGVMSFVAGAGATRIGRNGLRTAGQYAMCQAWTYDGVVWMVGGDVQV